MLNESPVGLVDQYGLPILQGDRLDEPVIPHPLSFGSILNTIAKTYSYRWDEALRHLPQNALAMRRDAYIKSLLQERKMPTINRSWQLKADDPKDPRQKEAVQLLTQCVKQTRRWRRFLAYLMEAIWYGRYGSQATWVQRPIGYGRRAWVIGKHKPVNGDKIQYAWDDTPVVFINSSGSGRYPPEFVVYTDRVPGLRLARQNWRDQFIIHTHEVDDADYFEGEMAGAVHGVGLRNSIYWAWWLRDEMLSWAVDFMKKVGTLGLLVFWYELGNKAAKSEAELNAKRASKDTALVMGRPSGKESATWGVDHFAAQYGGVEALQRMIQDYFEHHMERLIVGQTLSAGTEGGGLGGTGVAKLHEDTKFQLLQFDADNLAETLTDDLIGPMLRLNVPGADFGVRFEFNVESPENVDKMEAVSKAVAMGVTFRMDEIRELTGMSKPEEGDETIGSGKKEPERDEKRGEGRNRKEGNDQAENPSDQSADHVAYAQNPEFEALHPRDAHGKFAEKPHDEKELAHAAAEQPPPAKEPPPARKPPPVIKQLTEDEQFEQNVQVTAAIRAGKMSLQNAVMRPYKPLTTQGGAGLLINVVRCAIGTREVPELAEKKEGALKVPEIMSELMIVSGNVDEKLKFDEIRVIQAVRFIEKDANGKIVSKKPDTSERQAFAEWKNEKAESRGWFVDHAPNNFHYWATQTGNAGNACTIGSRSTTFRDAPGTQAPFANNGKEFITAFIGWNKKTGDKPEQAESAEYLGSIRWGYYIDQGGKIALRPKAMDLTDDVPDELNDSVARWDKGLLSITRDEESRALLKKNGLFVSPIKYIGGSGWKRP